MTCTVRLRFWLRAAVDDGTPSRTCRISVAALGLFCSNLSHLVFTLKRPGARLGVLRPLSAFSTLRLPSLLGNFSHVFAKIIDAESGEHAAYITLTTNSAGPRTKQEAQYITARLC